MFHYISEITGDEYKKEVLSWKGENSTIEFLK